jgi:hypothetical protein
MRAVLALGNGCGVESGASDNLRKVCRSSEAAGIKSEKRKALRHHYQANDFPTPLPTFLLTAREKRRWRLSLAALAPDARRDSGFACKRS